MSLPNAMVWHDKCMIWKSVTPEGCCEGFHRATSGSFCGITHTLQKAVRRPRSETGAATYLEDAPHFVSHVRAVIIDGDSSCSACAIRMLCTKATHLQSSRTDQATDRQHQLDPHSLLCYDSHADHPCSILCSNVSHADVGLNV